MDLFESRCFSWKFSLTLLIPSFIKLCTSDCYNTFRIEKESHDLFHLLKPDQTPCGSWRPCSLIYSGKDPVVSAITQLCIGDRFRLKCKGACRASLTISSGQDSIVIDCKSPLRQSFCAPQGNDLEVKYWGTFFSEYEKESDKLSDFLDVYQRPVYSGVLYLTQRFRCYRRYGRISKVNGTIVSSIQPEISEARKLCTTFIKIRHKTKKFCMKFIRFYAYKTGTSLEVISEHNSVTLSESNTATDDTHCLNIGQGDNEVIISVNPGSTREGGNHHIFIFEYYSVFEKNEVDATDANKNNDDDDDDDDDDLYWLFVIPGVISFCCCYCCYYCCKEDKDKVEGETSAQSDSDESEAQASLQEMGEPDQPDMYYAGDAMPSAPAAYYAGDAMPPAPAMYPPPPSQIGSGDEPPCYHSLFPNQKDTTV